MNTDLLKNIALGIKPENAPAEKNAAALREYCELVKDSAKLNMLRQAFAKLPDYEFKDLAAIVLGIEPPEPKPLGDFSLDNAFILDDTSKTKAEQE